MDNNLTDNIFNSIKELLGPTAADESFDNEILMDLNGAIMILTQIGIGDMGFMIVSKEETWADFGINEAELALVKPYLYLKTKKVFDPPVSTVLLQSMDNQINEYEWRLRTRAEIELGKGAG